MASITQKVGSSGKLSPYWRAKFKGADTRVVWLTTKCRDRRKSLAIAQRWEAAAFLAAGGELTQPLAQKVVTDVQKIYPHPDTLAITRNLVDQLLRDSIGTTLGGQSFAQFASEWLQSKEGKTAPATFTKYRGAVQRFLRFLPDRRRSASLVSISAGELERFRDAELKAGKTASTVSTTLAILSALFTNARRQGIVSHNVAESLERIQSDSEERLPFTEEQIRALLQVTDVEWRGMVLVGCYAGLRLGDAAGLSWSNVDLVTRALTYEAQKTSRRKRASERATVICLHPDLVDYLEALPTSDDPAAPLFPTLYGKPAGGSHGLSAEFSLLMDRAGVHSPMGVAKSGQGRQFRKLGYHSLRHSFVSRLANLEVSHDLRKELVGHASDAIHDRYTHLDLSIQRSAIAKLPSLL